MKTFLWTTLFWILAAIAGLLCLGFGNFGTQVLDNSRLVSVLPNNVVNTACDPIVATALESQVQDEPEVVSVDVEESDLSVEMNEIQNYLDILLSNQETIYSQMNESFATLLQNVSTLTELYSAPVVENEEPVDERELQRLQLQAQIEALQAEMANL